MATLTATELAELRLACASSQATVGYTKAQINAALQAIEDWFENTARAALNTTINTATSPLVLSAPVKKILVAHYLRQKFAREGV